MRSRARGDQGNLEQGFVGKEIQGQGSAFGESGPGLGRFR